MPEVRLIDGAAFEKGIDDAMKQAHDQFNFVAAQLLAIVKQTVQEQPTIEAEPVRHGRWDYGECTNCKRNLLELCCGDDCELSRHAEFDAVFCPFCGSNNGGG